DHLPRRQGRGHAGLRDPRRRPPGALTRRERLRRTRGDHGAKGAGMPQVTHVEWPAGDADRLQAFLEGLFGWQFDSPMEGMDYRMARTADNQGASVYPGAQRGLMFWYDFDDIDAYVAKVRGSGGEAEDKMPVPGMGWFAVCKDPEGDSFGLWQSDTSAPAPEG